MEYPYDVKCSRPQNIGTLAEAEEAERLRPQAPPPVGVILTGYDAQHRTGKREPVVMIGESYLTRDDLMEVLHHMAYLETVEVGGLDVPEGGIPSCRPQA